VSELAVTIDAPYDRLQALPRTLWLPGIVCSAGERGERLSDAARWLSALDAGELPPSDADFGDREAVQPIRTVAGELGLPLLARGTPAVAEQVLRTMLWHMDRIVDLQPGVDRASAIAALADAFRDAWRRETAGIDAADLALLRTLGDFAHLRWDRLQGYLRSGPWEEARRAAQRLESLPELAALIRAIGRSEHAPSATPSPAPRPSTARGPVALRAVETRLPGSPGEITGVRFTSRLERMVAAEAVMLLHPVLRRLWRARHAEARLLGWESEAVLVDWRPDPQRPRSSLAPPVPQALERGPLLLALDTSGSMRGAPERIAKAVVIAALRAAHESARACRLICFGGPGELIERELGQGDAGLQAMLELMGQSFDGGTDVQTPIERAIDRVHDARWSSADLLIVSDGEFGCVRETLQRLDAARRDLGLRVNGVLTADRETMGLMEVCDTIHWVRDWRRHGEGARSGDAFSPVHSKSLTALYFPNALSAQAARHRREPRD
jgi:uncharacterized protein with von Willebrand factor type A (vWA) domain